MSDPIEISQTFCLGDDSGIEVLIELALANTDTKMWTYAIDGQRIDMAKSKSMARKKAFDLAPSVLEAKSAIRRAELAHETIHGEYQRLLRSKRSEIEFATGKIAQEPTFVDTNRENLEAEIEERIKAAR
jgi:hypothetical protein